MRWSPHKPVFSHGNICAGIHKLKYNQLSHIEKPGRGIIVCWRLDCTRCDYYMLVDREMWAKKFLGEHTDG